MLRFTRHRGIALTAFLGVGALAVTGCTPPMPPDVLAAQAESQITCQEGTTEVAVPENLLGVMTFVGDALAAVCPDQGIIEVGPDDAAPLKIVDGTPSRELLQDFTSRCEAGDVIYVPLFNYPVTLAYNIPGLEGLVLPPDVIAGILNGTITSWEDPAITGANEGFDLTLLPEIEVFSAEQPNGAVEAMTAWLSEGAADVWTGGTIDVLDGDVQFPTALDLTSELAFTDGAVAVLPVFEAFNAFVPTAALPVVDDGDGASGQTVIAFPDDPQLAKIGSGAVEITVDEAGNIAASPGVGGIPNPENFDFAASKIILQEGQPEVGWPVMGTGHLLVCDDPSDPLPLSVAQYALRLAGQGAFETFGLTPLPEPVRIRTFEPLKVIVAEPSE